MGGQKKLECDEVKFSLHAFEKIRARGIYTDEIEVVLFTGEIIAEYLTDKPFPSYLLLGFVHKRPIHVVIARDPNTLICIVVTAYEPDAEKWQADFKKKKK